MEPSFTAHTLSECFLMEKTTIVLPLFIKRLALNVKVMSLFVNCKACLIFAEIILFIYDFFQNYVSNV